MFIVFERIWTKGKPIQRSVEVYMDNYFVGRKPVPRFVSAESYAYQMLVEDGLFEDQEGVSTIHQLAGKVNKDIVYSDAFVSTKADL